MLVYYLLLLLLLLAAATALRWGGPFIYYIGIPHASLFSRLPFVLLFDDTSLSPHLARTASFFPPLPINPSSTHSLTLFHCGGLLPYSTGTLQAPRLRLLLLLLPPPPSTTSSFVLLFLNSLFDDPASKSAPTGHSAPVFLPRNVPLWEFDCNSCDGFRACPYPGGIVSAHSLSGFPYIRRNRIRGKDRNGFHTWEVLHLFPAGGIISTVEDLISVRE